MLSGLRNFFIVFLVALLGFGVIGHILANQTIPNIVQGDTESNGNFEDASDTSVSDDSSSDAQNPVKVSGETYSLAVLCVDLDKKLASVFFIHTNDGYETCIYTSIPGKAPIENNGAQSTLAKIYADNGTDFLISKLKFVLGFEIDGYAVLNAVDISGKGRSITELATELNFICNIKVSFNYPNPNYVPPIPEISSDESAEDESEDLSEDTSEDTSEDENNEKFINIPAGSYSLNGNMSLTGPTSKIQNYLVLLDSNYNIYAYEIYKDVLEKLFLESKSSSAFSFFDQSTFDTAEAARKLFTDFDKYEYEYPENAEAWNDAIAVLRELEIGEN